MAIVKALVVDRPGKLVVANVRCPELGEHEALVKMKACGICNSTDAHVIDGTMPYHSQYPAILGHESVGEVVAVGKKCRAIRPGMRFTRPAAIWPGATRDGLSSAWGGFAEYGVVRDRLALAADGQATDARNDFAMRQAIVPDGISSVDAALAISLAEVSSWMRKAGDVRGKRVVILGTGIAGMAMAFFSRLAGASKVAVLGRRQARLDAMVSCGADKGFNSSSENIGAVRDFTDGGADWLFEAAGAADSLAEWLPCLRAGGRVAVYGLAPGTVFSLPLNRAPYDFTFRAPPAEEFLTYHWVCKLMLDGKLDPKLFRSHTWNWPGDALEAFEMVRRREVTKGFLVFA